jgi:Co/Zn/Cd efflux system component
MSQPTPITTYRATRLGRILNAVMGLFLVGLALTIASAIIQRHAAGRPLSWPEWLFTSVVIALFFGFGVERLLRAVESKPRIVVFSDGFVYAGALGERRISWTDVVDAAPVKTFPNEYGWLKITLRPPAKPAVVRLDVQGLSPSYLAFLGEIYKFVPEVLEKYTKPMLKRR